VEFVRFEEESFPFDASPEEREAILLEFLEDRSLSLEFVVTALPTDRGTQRQLRFPFTDAKKIAQAVPFEVEEAVPVPISELIVTHQPIRKREGSSEVLAVLSPRSDVAAHLTALRLAGLEPRILEMEGAVLSNLSSFLSFDQGNRLLLDIGHRKTNVCLLVDGMPALLRSIPVAGAHLTRALVRDLKMAPASAEEFKRESGVFEGTGTKATSPLVEAELDRLAIEILRTVQSAVSEPLQELAPDGILLVGGSARLRGINAFLEERIGLPCHPVQVPPGEEGRSLLASTGPERFAQAAALALRGAPATRITQINFRQGEFEYNPDLSDLRRGLRVPAALAALLVLLCLGYLGARGYDAGRQSRALRTQLGEIYTNTFPGERATSNPSRAIKEQVRETRHLARHLGVSGHNLSPLDILREIATRIPDSHNIGLTDLQIEQSSVQARGFAPSFEAVDRFRAELAKVGAFREVRLSDVVTDTKTGGKNFSLTIRLQEKA
jgi:type IV pilus assembly protein PilM